MQEEMEFTPEALKQMEPPTEAMVQGSEPIDKPVSCSEFLFYVITLLLASLTWSIHWPPLHTTAIIAALCFVGLEFSYLLMPPRLSWIRVGFLCTILFQTKLFFN
jgi:hypothetical protein